MIPEVEIRAKQRELEERFAPLMFEVAEAFSSVEADRDLLGLRWLTECIAALATSSTRNLRGDKGKPAAGHAAIH